MSAAGKAGEMRKTEVQLVNELAEAHARIAALEAQDADCEQAKLEAQRRASQVTLIYEIGRRVSGALDWDVLLPEIVTAVRDACDCYTVALLLLDEKRGHLTLQSIASISGAVVPENLQITVGVGMVGRAAASGKTQVSGKVDENVHYVRWGTEQIESELAVPIWSGQRVIGVLDLQSDRQAAFDESDVAAMQALSTQIAIAVENAHLLKEARVRAHELAVLNELGQAFTARLSVEKVLEEVWRGASRLMNITTFGIGLYDPEQHEITFPITINDSEIDRQITVISADHGLSGYIVRHRTSVLIEDNVRERQEALGITMVGEEPLSWLGVPLIVGDRVLGVMFVQSYDVPHAYDEHDRELLTAIGSSTAIALQNAYLFEETEAALAETKNIALELGVLNELGKALTTRLTVDEVLEEAYRQASRLVDTTNFYIGLYNPDRREIVFPYNISDSKVDREITTLSADEGITGYIVHNRTSLLFEDNVREQVRALGIDSVGADAQSWLGVPMIIGDQVLGVMAVQSRTTPRLYGEHERELLTAIASQVAIALRNAQMVENLEHMIEERTAKLRESIEEQKRLQQEIIEAQRQALQELSTPIIPVMDQIIVMPLIGGIDSMRAREITRNLLAGVREHQARIVILDITGVPVVDSGVANHLTKTIQAARLKGAHTIVTGISEAVAETIVDLGIDWGSVETLSDLQSGLLVALRRLHIRLEKLPSPSLLNAAPVRR